MRPEGELVLAYGAGVDSVACLLLLRQLGLRPAAIVMANPGSEKRGSWLHLREWVNPRLRKWGWPEVTVISRAEEGAYRPTQKGRIRRPETLREDCMRRRTLPAIAFNGDKTCSDKYKSEPQRWWSARQVWMQERWAAGEKLVKVIGYDFDEPARVQRAIAAMVAPPPRPPGHKLKECPECRTDRCRWPRDRNKWERVRFNLWFPVFEARLTRAMCEQLIRDAGMPVPPKSSCTFCPNNTLEEWEELRRDEPEEFARAVEMSRNAELENPHDIGLMRRNPSGRKQLHEWADGLYGLGPLFEEPIKVACGCST